MRKLRKIPLRFAHSGHVSVAFAPETNYAGKISGFQLGILNMTGQLRGLQLGVLNIAGNATIPILPIFNLGF